MEKDRCAWPRKVESRSSRSNYCCKMSSGQKAAISSSISNNVNYYYMMDSISQVKSVVVGCDNNGRRMKIVVRKEDVKQILDAVVGLEAAAGGAGSSSFGDENDEMLSLIAYCSFTYTWIDPRDSPSLQDLKRLKLIQLFSLIRIHKKPLDPQIILPPLFIMLSANLFRPLPPPNNPLSATTILPDDDDNFMLNPAKTWSHLQIIYDILLRVIITTQPEELRAPGFIDHSFLHNLLVLFQSDDPRERESLKNVFHRIYSKFTFYRSFMRKAMNDVFLHYIFETEQRHPGIGELLEIWGTIINGFSVPLKDEHKLFFTRVLIPLHRPKGMQAYHKQLAYCVFQFVQKEAELAGVVVRGILKYWPLTNCHKEIVLIGELEELVETLLQPSQYRTLALPLCTQITKCLNSWNSQVAERALYVWNSEKFWRMAAESMEQVFPILVRGLEDNLKGHWSTSVKELTQNVKRMLQELDPCLYTNCLLHLEIQQTLLHQQHISRRHKWNTIEEKAAANTQLLPATATATAINTLPMLC
nr:serine/threonine protein phosphatase 2A 57 kDa regulatory subunit B' beta isoform-like [Ipomoea batatas]